MGDSEFKSEVLIDALNLDYLMGSLRIQMRTPHTRGLMRRNLDSRE